MNTNLYKIIKRHTMLNKIKLRGLINNVNYISKNKIKGDIVECGVWMGGSSALTAYTLLENADIRTLRLFDSFQDICEPLPIDGKQLVKDVGGLEHAKGRLQPVHGFYKKFRRSPGNAKVVLSLLTRIVGYPKNKVKIYKGWFQKTVKCYSGRIDKIALLFLDCDLYESTKVCLENLYDKVVPNGIIMVDDYRVYEGCKKAVDDYIAKHGISAKIQIVADTTKSTGCIFWVKK